MSVIQPIEPGKPGNLGSSTILGTFGNLELTIVGELFGLLIQLDAITYQIKAKLQTNLTPLEIQQLKASTKLIADNMYLLIK